MGRGSLGDGKRLSDTFVVKFPTIAATEKGAAFSGRDFERHFFALPAHLPQGTFIVVLEERDAVDAVYHPGVAVGPTVLAELLLGHFWSCPKKIDECRHTPQVQVAPMRHGCSPFFG